MREGRVDYEGAGRLLRFYEDGLHGYTYLEGIGRSSAGRQFTIHDSQTAGLEPGARSRLLQRRRQVVGGDAVPEQERHDGESARRRRSRSRRRRPRTSPARVTSPDLAPRAAAAGRSRRSPAARRCRRARCRRCRRPARVVSSVRCFDCRSNAKRCPHGGGPRPRPRPAAPAPAAAPGRCVPRISRAAVHQQAVRLLDDVAALHEHRRLAVPHLEDLQRGRVRHVDGAVGRRGQVVEELGALDLHARRDPCRSRCRCPPPRRCRPPTARRRRCAGPWARSAR